MKIGYKLILLFSIILTSCENKQAGMEKTDSTTISGPNHLLFIGTYTRDEGFVNGKADGIYILNFNSKTGKLESTGLSIPTVNPSYLSVNSVKKRIYAVNEIAGEEPNGGGKIKAFSYDLEKSEIVELNSLDAMGGAPCYIMEHKNHLFTANYVGGNHAVYSLDGKGSLDKNTQVIQNQGKGESSRQEGPHAHMIKVNPYSNNILGVDLGTDIISQFKFNKNKGFLNKVGEIILEEGSGPRHLDFHPSKNFLYVLNELNGTIDVFKGEKNKYSHIQNIPSVLSPDNHKAGCADIHVHPNGKFLYASNRGPFNTIAVYNIKEDGQLDFVSERSSNGFVPRAFTIDPSGKFLLVANQNSDNIVVFGIDEASGRILETGNEYSIPTPVCLKWE